jgi:very-short-patch-repair endonuclease
MRGSNQNDVERARKLRRDQTVAEARLWQQLRGRQLDGLKFVRQAPAGPFLADFLCRERKLIIEVDGATHLAPDEVAYDAQRTAYLEEKGYKVIRVQNDEVLRDMDQVLTSLREKLHL